MRTYLPIALATLLLASPLSAQETPPPDSKPCDDFQTVAYNLYKDYGESLAYEGTGPGQTKLLIFAAPLGVTWTAVILTDSGTACPVYEGANWRSRHRWLGERIWDWVVIETSWLWAEVRIMWEG